MIFLDYVRILLSSLGSVAVLYLLTRLIGPRQVTELTVFDYLNSITIGSIAAEMALTKTMPDFLEALIATLIYGGATLGISYLTQFCPRLRPLLIGRSRTLFSHGRFDKKNMRKSKLDLNEFLMSARNAGYFSLSEVECAILEPNGKISFLPKSEHRPLTPKDTDLTVEKAEAPYIVVMEGKTQEEPLARAGFDRTWLSRALREKSVDIADVFLATLTESGTLEIFSEKKSRHAG